MHMMSMLLIKVLEPEMHDQLHALLSSSKCREEPEGSRNGTMPAWRGFVFLSVGLIRRHTGAFHGLRLTSVQPAPFNLSGKTYLTGFSCATRSHLNHNRVLTDLTRDWPHQSFLEPNSQVLINDNNLDFIVRTQMPWSLTTRPPLQLLETVPQKLF
ncbi:hypothetical protein AMECASPLE_017375 [Ameca splendens]|uniref:Uncharacterized protein n=1 Tax=Ameca splendens TaxID=208324 RepID=A0ABV0XFH2_9TELE